MGGLEHDDARELRDLSIELIAQLDRAVDSAQEQLAEPEILAHLEVCFCPDCTLVQINETVRPEVLFCEDYPYFSSVSPSLMAHFQASAERIAALNLNTARTLLQATAVNGGGTFVGWQIE